MYEKVAPGVIRNREFARQIKDFSGLRFGQITPTDIDGFMDFGDRLFVVIEGKHAGSMLKTGQRLALERLVDACHCPPRRIAVAIVIDHIDESSVDVDYATCTVRTIRWNGKWVSPMEKGITCRRAIERLHAMSENMKKPVFKVV